MGRFPNGDRPSRKRLAAPDRLVGSGHPLSVSRDRIRYAPGTVTALTRSADAAGVLVVGGLLTLLTWVVTPIWVGGALLFPRSSCSRRWRSPPRSLLAATSFASSLPGIATGNADGAPPFVAWNELYRNGLKSALLSAVLLAPLVLGAARSARDRRSRDGLVDLASVAEPVRAALGGGGVAAVGAVAGGLVGTVAAAYLLAFAYVRPAALAAFAASGRLRDGLHPRRVGRVAGSGTYATAWLVAAATLGAGYTLAGPFVPLVVGVALVFVVHVAAHGLYGRGGGDGAGSGRCGRRRRSDRSDRGGSGPRRSIGRPRTPPTPEVPPMVQTGRSVPLGRTGGSVRQEPVGRGLAGRASTTRCPTGPVAPLGPTVDSTGTRPTGSRSIGMESALTTTASGEFEWDVDVDDREDKN